MVRMHMDCIPGQKRQNLRKLFDYHSAEAILKSTNILGTI
jgi:hypothetical protein